MSSQPPRRGTSAELAIFLLMTKRDRDVKVLVNNTLVSIADVFYDREADCVVIELEEKEIP